jgi:hypothetical protein
MIFSLQVCNLSTAAAESSTTILATPSLADTRQHAFSDVKYLRIISSFSFEDLSVQESKTVGEAFIFNSWYTNR